ncbi:hypothetical protein RRG08_009491 [Elysia crispata]|uniref:G-protein coupled receptors family 1 profile domain-containing protein n=1 Tax=Elysia crispata TaxID=231223 RepID=A0AAE0YJ67_9GAST|nr:hypothetical protein RRG08_009491 [Elysia crispata]
MLLCPFFIRHENSTLTGDISNALANGVGFKTVAIGLSDPAVDPKTWFILVTSFQCTTSNSIGIMGFMNITSNSSSSNNYSNNNDQNNNVTRTSVSTMNNTACTLRFVRKLSRTSSTISLVYTHNGPELENISFSISVFAQLSSFVAVIICTVILVRKLAQSSRWRAQTGTKSDTAKTGAAGSMSPKDKRLVKMITFLSVIFIACFLPSAVNLIVMICSAEYSIVGRYRNLFQVGWWFLNCLEAVNSSVNIFVYYKMSSRYRKCFRELFKLPDKEDGYTNNNAGRD